MITTRKDLDALLKGQLGQPHALLGMHPHTQDGNRGLVVRALIQDAVTCEIVDPAGDPEVRYPMGKHHDLGFFEAFIDDRREVFSYQLRITRTNGELRQFHDPYRFLPTLARMEGFRVAEVPVAHRPRASG